MDKTTINIQGIKCDNEKCDFLDMSVLRKDYDNWLNKPCPKCGNSLLTEDDYNLIKKLEKCVSTINSCFCKTKETDVLLKTSLKLNGTGFIQEIKTTVLAK